MIFCTPCTILAVQKSRGIVGCKYRKYLMVCTVLHCMSRSGLFRKLHKALCYRPRWMERTDRRAFFFTAFCFRGSSSSPPAEAYGARARRALRRCTTSARGFSACDSRLLRHEIVGTHEGAFPFPNRPMGRRKCLSKQLTFTSLLYLVEQQTQLSPYTPY